MHTILIIKNGLLLVKTRAEASKGCCVVSK